MKMTELELEIVELGQVSDLTEGDGEDVDEGTNKPRD
jgi:hypothetical protein